MHGEDPVTALVVNSGTGSRAFAEADFPLAVTLAGAGDLAIGPAASGPAIAWLLLHPNGISIQPEKSRVPVLLNGAPVTRADWLTPGDELRFGQVRVVVGTTDGVPSLLVAELPVRAAAPEPTPASEPGQEARLGRKFGAADSPSGTTPRRRNGMIAAIAGFAVLGLGVAFVLLASPINLRFTPEADSVSVTGFPPPVLVGDRYLALPGTVRVEAKKEGFKDISRTIEVRLGARSELDLAFEKLGGLVKVTVRPVDSAKVFVDGVERGGANADIEVAAGEHDFRIEAERYLPEVRRVAVEGLGRKQEIEVELKPAWGQVQLASNPTGAQISVGGAARGTTPATIELLQGEHAIELSLPGWKTARRTIAVKAGASEAVPVIELERIDGTLALSTDPAGATVTVNGQFRGQTPLSLALVSGRDHQIAVSKAGYEGETRSIKVEGDKTTRTAIQLQPEFGTVFITTTPPGVALKINGRASGSGSQRLSLQTLPQVIEATMAGHEPLQVSVTPQKGISKRVDISLKTVGQALKDKYGRGFVSPGGQKMVLAHIVSPVRISLGSPRRDPARRSNEVEYAAELTRSFLISEKEVTNAEFRKFKAGHSSGTIQGASLDGAEQPVVNVSWDDAARYANWMSARENLTPAYRDQGGRMVPVVPLPDGYRLPTEAEWEFAARYEAGLRAGGSPLKFAWGDEAAPPANSGNFAHEGSGLPFAIPGYVDSYVGAAPVGKFPPNRARIFDLSGNVAEWCHDFYDVVMNPDAAPRRDPAGPANGRFHVIKGSSWRSGSTAELRFAYRDYAEKPRDDLGFRVARYVDAP